MRGVRTILFLLVALALPVSSSAWALGLSHCQSERAASSEAALDHNAHAMHGHHDVAPDHQDGHAADADEAGCNCGTCPGACVSTSVFGPVLGAALPSAEANLRRSTRPGRDMAAIMQREPSLPLRPPRTA